MLKRNNLHQYQHKAVEFIKDKKRCALLLDMGLGKEQPISEPILTPDGWKTIGSLAVGDEVIGSNGRGITVLEVFPQGIKDVYNVTFSDGTSVRCGLDHLWGVNVKKKYYKKSDKRYDVLSLKQIIESGLIGDKGFKYNAPIVSPIEFSTKELPMEPYLLGLLLGDGGFTGNGFTFTNSENDLLDYVQLSLNKCNKRVYENHYQLCWFAQYSKELKELGLYGLYSNEKFIPEIYLYGDINQRTAILSGLINTDGSIQKGVSCNFSSTSESLAEGVVNLARSLGFVCTTSLYHRKDGKSSSHAVHIMGNLSCLKLSEKHLSRLKSLRKPYYKSIVNIEKIGVEESVCIKVDSDDSLYVTKDFILTHNTTSTLTAIKDLTDDFAICRTLVIAPLRVANSVWKQEAEKWEHTQDLNITICTGSTKERISTLNSQADIYVINRENIKWLVDTYQKNWKWDCIVIDESSSFKSYKSQRFKALKSILHLTNYMILLTGTPASNGYMDLWSQMYLVDKGEALGKNITAYRSRFFSQFDFKYVLNKGAKKIIKERIAPFTLSMKAEDYLELPECVYLYNKIEMDKKLSARYTSFAEQLVLDNGDEEITAINAAVLTNKLMQFTNGAVYDEDKTWHHIHDLKIDALKELVEENQGEPLLVAYNFKSDLERLTEAFPNAVILDKDNKTIENWNKGKIPMLLAHPACLHGDTEVLTEFRGWVKITEIKNNERVHDGIEFVKHDGCQYSGIKPVINRFGITLTKNHKLLIDNEWKEAKDVQNNRRTKRKAYYANSGNGCSESGMPDMQINQYLTKAKCNKIKQGIDSRRSGTGLSEFKLSKKQKVSKVYDLVNCGERNRFLIRNNKGEVFVSHNSAGHGLNLQKGGSIIVWFGLNHSLELYEQFNGRLNRQGQTKPVRIVHLVMDGTIDQKVISALDKKANVQNELMAYFKLFSK